MLAPLSKIYQQLENGDSSLYEKRFPLGKELDINEFSVQLEELGASDDVVNRYNLTELYSMSSELSLLKNMIDSRNLDRNSDERLQKFETNILDFEVNPNIESEAYIYKKINEVKEVKIDDNDITLTLQELTDLYANLKIFNNKNFDDVYSKFCDSKYISLNEITVLDSLYMSNETLTKKYRTYRIGQILEMLTDTSLATLQKSERKQMYAVTTGTRPSTSMYNRWNGFQVIDLDLKNSSTPLSIHDIEKIKEQLYEQLKHYKWLVSVALSSSKTGIHIYTKVTRPHHMFTDYSENEQLMKYWYRMSYISKHASILWVLKNVCNIGLSKVEDGKRKYVIDMSVARITQGILISNDVNAKINMNFEDLHPIIELYVPPSKNLKPEEWLLCDDILTDPAYLRWEHERAITLDATKVYDNSNMNASDFVVGEFEFKNIRQVSKKPDYTMRYNVCNTLASLLGESGRDLAHFILKSLTCHNEAEINGMYNCAISNRKTVSSYGLKIVKQCGLPVNATQEASQKMNEGVASRIVSLIKSATEGNFEKKYNHSLKLNKKQYLGNIENELGKKIVSGKANVIVSAPGTGKTEWIKSMSTKENVLLVLPYISVIDAKVMKDMNISENFEVFMGDRNVNEIERGSSVVMTIDKFSRLDPDKIAYLFKYIVIDESHLMFTSKYRLGVMSNALKKLKTFISISDFDSFAAKVILMTGTPTGELIYFDFYDILNSIKINKPIGRKKKATFNICMNTEEMIFLISEHIANCIKSGTKVIYPTNKGDIYASKLVGMVEHILGKKISWGYYKKSNAETEVVQKVNELSTMDKYDLLLASNYLSVGIDINDVHSFECIYDNSFTGFEIEQFNSRIRKVDLISTIYIPVNDSSGEILESIFNTSSFSLELEKSDRNLIRDYLDIANKQMQLSISYDPITNKILTPGFNVENGQVVFNLEEHELSLFEDRYMTIMNTPFFVSKLLSEYEYQIYAKVIELYDNELVNEVISVGNDAAKFQSELHNAYRINSFNWLIDNNDYENQHGAIIHNVASLVYAGEIPIVEIKSETAEITTDETFIGTLKSISVPDRNLFVEQSNYARKFLSMYSKETAKYVYSNMCITNSGRLNISEIERYVNLIRLVQAEERGSLGNEIKQIVNDIYEYMKQFEFGENKDETFVEQHVHESMIDQFTVNYLSALNLHLRTEKMISKYRSEVSSFFNVLTVKSKKSKGIRFNYRVLPTPDNKKYDQIGKFNSMFFLMFEINDRKIPEEMKYAIKKRHLSEDAYKMYYSIHEYFTRKKDMQYEP